MTTTQPVATVEALMNLSYNDETGRYIAMLERKLAVLTFRDLKMSALLELLTDLEWDDEKLLSAENDELRKIAETALQKRLGVSPTDARLLVQERWTKYNGTTEQPDNTPLAESIVAGPESDTPIKPRTNAVLTQAVPIEDVPPMADRVAAYMNKQKAPAPSEEDAGAGESLPY